MEIKNIEKRYLLKYARLDQHKTSLCCFEQILEAAHNKTVILTATYLQSRKPFNKVEQDMLGTAGKVRAES